MSFFGKCAFSSAGWSLWAPLTPSSVQWGWVKRETLSSNSRGSAQGVSQVQFCGWTLFSSGFSLVRVHFTRSNRTNCPAHVASKFIMTYDISTFALARKQLSVVSLYNKPQAGTFSDPCAWSSSSCQGWSHWTLTFRLTQPILRSQCRIRLEASDPCFQKLRKSALLKNLALTLGCTLPTRGLPPRTHSHPSHSRSWGWCLTPACVLGNQP